MAKSPTESKIPIFHNNPLKSKISKPLSTLSSRLRAHLDVDGRPSPSSVLFGFLNATAGISGLKNVNVAGKSIAATSSRISKNAHHAASHDDLKACSGKLQVTRPTNICISGHSFPSTLVTADQRYQYHAITGVEHVGSRVRLNSGKEGVLRFVGKTQFGEGVWCGVELDNEEGTSDGTVNNVRYFSCPNNRGVFVLISNLSLIVPDEVREYVSDVSDSGPHSLLGVAGEIDSQHQQNDISDRDAVTYFRTENPHRCSSFSLQENYQTPTPNSSNSSYVAPSEWKSYSRNSSSTSSLVLNSLRGLPSSLDPLTVHMSKHSSIECEDSLGILTPDQMAEMTVYRSEAGNVLGAGSCDDFRSLAMESHCKASDNLDNVTDCRNIRCPSMDNLMNTPMPAECLLDICDSADVVPNELTDRLFSEQDTCIMTSSTISDQLESSKDAVVRSPSMEELLAGDLSTTLIAPEQMDCVVVPPTSFVTSVTSIGSWDNGYQGDGECSRPTSRGADASPQSRAKIAIKPSMEPMTDSDFFTESDADLGYEDMSSSSSCLRGDRKARVIDGKLFGSPSHTRETNTSQSYNSQILSSELYVVQNERNVPEDMDSSGIYSDLEKRSDVTEKTNVELSDVPMSEEGFSDASGISSAKSVSSQKLVNGCDDEKKIAKAEEMRPAAETHDQRIMSKNVPLKATIPVKLQNGVKRSSKDALPKEKEPMKSFNGSNASVKLKTPRRNVASKVKSMISAPSKCSEDENQENQPVNVKTMLRKTNGGGKWDSVISKIEKSKTQEKLKAEKLKEVKCKVICNGPRTPPSKLHKDVKPFSPNGNAINKMQNGCTRPKDSNIGYRFKMRKTRTRMNGESPQQSSATTAPASLSRASSRNSSVTDISDSHMDISQHSLPAVVAGKKTTSSLCSPLSENGVGTGTLQSIVGDAKDIKMSTLPASVDARKTIQRKIGSVNSLVENSKTGSKGQQRKMTYRRTVSKVAPLKDQNRLQNSNGSGPVKNTVPKSLADHSSRSADVGYKITSRSSNNHNNKQLQKQSSIVEVNPLLGHLKRTTDGMEAFIVLFQRLTADMDVFTLPYIKRELAKYKEDWSAMKSKLEEANVSCRRLKEETETQKAMHEQKLEELRNSHSAQLDRLNELHKQELGARSENYEKQLSELEERLKNQEVTLQSQFNENLRQIQQQAEEKLENILEETKNQVNVLKIENDAWKEKLVKESWRKLEQVECKYKSKMESMETSYRSQLSEADEEAKKREELFLTSMSTKRKQQNTRQESNLDAGIMKPNHSETLSYGPKPDMQNMEDEVCSLRVVLDLKHSEIQDLRKQNEKLRKDVQDLPFITQKLDSAQARIEDLNAQLQTKIENEKKLLKENRKLLETVQHESEKKKRLTFQNEELLWKLKKSAQVAKTLAVFNNNFRNDEQDLIIENGDYQSTPKNPKKSNCKCQLRFNENALGKQLKRSRTDADIKLVESTGDGDSSPKVLGVVEKNDSVSWVLEMDESPLAVASRMLRRASSLRGVPSIKKKSNNSQHSLTLPSRSIKSPSSRSARTSPSKSPKSIRKVNPAMTKSTSDATATTKTDVTSNDDENVIVDISSFFAFLQDSDFESDLVVSDDVDAGETFYSGNNKTSTYSSNSSDSSLDLDIVYNKESNPRRYTWTKSTSDDRAGADKDDHRAVAYSSSTISDTEDSESVDCFLAPSAGSFTTMLNEQLVNNSTNLNE